MNLIESIQKTKQDGRTPIIAEIKRVIPKLNAESGLKKDARPAETLAAAYEKGGACGISIVTEKAHFGGEPENDVPAVLRCTALPLLIKDFILDEKAVDYYEKLVAATGEENLLRVTLLLTAQFSADKAPALLTYIHAKGMKALFETRTAADLKHRYAATPKIIGVNNKNIDDLEMGEDNLRVNREMLNEYRNLAPFSFIISQSAHRTPADVRLSIAAGADAVLAGTAFMTAADPVKTVAEFVQIRVAVR